MFSGTSQLEQPVTSNQEPVPSTKYQAPSTKYKSKRINAAKQEQTKVTSTSDWTFVKIWRKITRKIKTSDKYNDAVGERYKIVGDEISFDPNEAKPELKTKKVPNGWEFSFNLMGYFDGIKLFRKRTDEADFKYLATDTALILKLIK